MAISFLLLTGVLLSTVLLLAMPLSRLFSAMVDTSPTAWPLPGRSRLLSMLTVPAREMSWGAYALAIVAFNGLGAVLLFAILMLQGGLPLNPLQLPGLSWHLALNTAISFVTNTNWQAFSGENTLSTLSQMTGLAVQNFLSAASGIAVALAFIRSFARRSASTLGNAWQDLWGITLYILLPVSLLLALFFVSQGVVQSFDGAFAYQTLEGIHRQIALGPVASQEAIKLLGTNGGGFYGANSAHPFENPTGLANLVQMVAMLLIPAALCMTFGRAVGDSSQGRALLWSMSVILVIALAVVVFAEYQGNPHLLSSGATASANMEGKETRFGILLSAFYAVITTATSSGAVNAMHDSFTALGGLIPMWLMQIGEVVFGGVGSGLYSMLLFVILTVFIAGLMIGRTPEYLGKKIGTFEMKMTALAILISPTLVLAGAAVAVTLPAGRDGVLNPGAHSFSEILYAFSSAANNNGSAFAGLSVNTPFYNLALGIAMLVGRFGIILPVLAIAGALVSKPRQPAGSGTLPTNGPLFIALLTGTVLLVGALTFIPALALGPIAEHLHGSVNLAGLEK
ncbi:potassium-transporting ATPase subunit KdpA [Biostraticola tofi]|uniref:Potassium-transporting ATPase potassium-binding subunit n=1 Tax=Biostraticola tofi TaxID=466109 RepID=A0A4R3Z192_9GAMM|nr:potassium-transporting ATPase subunit KdpA [Biostraticola tofi]TCV97998.1 K+-transporting ATPase ATPase A chain [Biostraticola tofi]